MPDKRHRNVCPYCGGDGEKGCVYYGRTMGTVEELSVEDWRQIYWFIHHVQLPFLHRLIINAQERARQEQEAKE